MLEIMKTVISYIQIIWDIYNQCGYVYRHYLSEIRLEWLLFNELILEFI